jgi:hypothetical protein
VFCKISVRWLETYLHNRKQRIVLQTHDSTTFVSRWETSRHGVPHGSVLGPLLFNVYINDLPNILKGLAHTILHANDTTIIVSSKDITTLNYKINLIMNCISKWLKNNQLVLNLEKPYVCNLLNLELWIIQYIKIIMIKILILTKMFSGMYLDCHLQWKQYSDNLTKKLRTAIFMLRKLQPIVSEQIL